VDARRSYDAVAGRYLVEFLHELDGKPLDRALLKAVVELAGGGTVADVGGGPGVVAGHLRSLGGRTVSADLSPRMCALVDGPSACADMVRLPFAAASVAAVVCLYAVIHLDDGQRARAYAEFGRVLRAGGHALVSFHVSDAATPAGGTTRFTEWWGEDVDLVFRFLEPEGEAAAMERAGLRVTARLERLPYPGVEHQSRRAYLLAQRP
jgi:SAM-dependent methyltransferase